MSELVLSTERFDLRTLEPSDAVPLLAFYGDAEAMRYIGSSGKPIDVRETEAAIARHMAHQREHGFSLWAIVDRSDGSVIGCAGLYLVEGRGPEVEIVYQLVRERWGEGIATETARACLAHGLGPLGLPRVIGLAYPENVPSVRVMQKIGMRADGEVHAYGRTLLQFSATADEFDAAGRSTRL